MKLKQKILTGYGIVFVLMVIIVLWSVFNIVLLQKTTHAILRQNYRSIIAAEKMLDALEQQNNGILLISLGDTKKGIDIFHNNGTDFIDSLGNAKDSMYLEEEKELNKSITIYYEKYREQFSLLMETINRKEPLGLSPLITYEKTIYPVFLNVRDACIRLRNLNEHAMYDDSMSADRMARRAIWSTIIVSVCGLVAVFILSLILVRRIVKPLNRFMDASRKISAGDYSVQVKVNTRDELGGLADEFNKMSSQLDHYHKMDIDRIVTEKNKNDVIISSIDDGLVVFSPDLRISGINPAARKILGLESKDTNNLQYTDIIPVANICDMIRKTAETGLPPKEISDEQRIMILNVDDKSCQYIFSIIPTKDRNGNLSDILLLLRDVTRIKEIEHIKNDFIMAASHELKTPLTSMGMSIALLLEHVAPKLQGKERDLIVTIHEDVQRMKSLTNDLLDLSRTETGKINLGLKSIPLKNIFKQVRGVFRNQLEMRDITLEFESPEDLPDVIADENKISWVLSNLISNASRYVDSGGHIGIHAEVKGFYVHVSVEDDGAGIPIEYQSKLFQKLIQVDGQQSYGTGLGLAICKEIVTSHRGTIWVESSPGHGSIFTFTLPIT